MSLQFSSDLFFLQSFLPFYHRNIPLNLIWFIKCPLNWRTVCAYLLNSQKDLYQILSMLSCVESYNSNKNYFHWSIMWSLFGGQQRHRYKKGVLNNLYSIVPTKTTINLTFLKYFCFSIGFSSWWYKQ